MKKEPKGIWSQLKQLIVPDTTNTVSEEVTNNRILAELEECFTDSLVKESVGTSLLFNTHFIIILHPNTFEERLPSLPVIVKEAVKLFNKKLQGVKDFYEEMSPISSNWHFRFGPAAQFNNELIEPHDIRVIGMLTGEKEMPGQGKTKVTLKPKKSNVYDKMDINPDLFRQIDFRESGTFSVKINTGAPKGGTQINPRSGGSHLAQIEYFLADKNAEEIYPMKDKEIVIARKNADNQSYSNYLLIDSPYVSNPHARIRFNESAGKFQIASFSRNETRVNEQVIPKSELANPVWLDLNDNSQVLLNGMVTLQFKAR